MGCVWKLGILRIRRTSHRSARLWQERDQLRALLDGPTIREESSGHCHFLTDNIVQEGSMPTARPGPRTAAARTAGCVRRRRDLSANRGGVIRQS